MDVPDLDEYQLHREADRACVDGVPMPGLSAAFYRRTTPDGEHSVGIYRFAGVEILQAWGYADEPHCRAHRVREPNGDWGAPPGLPPGPPRRRPGPPGRPHRLRRLAPPDPRPHLP
ncbi:hypothetical protein ACFQX7_05790 [Luedemannella flava]